MRRLEGRRLKADYPHLYATALAIEAGAAAQLVEVRGLGRNWSWTDADKQEAFGFFETPIETPCGCHGRRMRRITRRSSYQPRPARLDPWRDVIGLWTDARVAAAAGVNVTTVAKMRARQTARPWISLLQGGPTADRSLA